MSLYKRGGTWWTDFSVNGQRFRLSLDTTDWREAQRQEKERIAQASAGKLTTSGQQFARLAFSEAADRFINERVAHLAPRSIQTDKERTRPLKKHFSVTPLIQISADSIRQYIAERKAAPASNKTINLELGVLRGILKRAKRWHVLADDVKPLPVRSLAARVLSYEEKLRLLGKAAIRPEWCNARLAMILALNTTMRSCEIKGLRWRDVNFMDRALTVRRASTKTDAGERVIPLNANAWIAIRELWDRAKGSGGSEADHFVFPACENGNIEPTRPMKSWRSAWRKLTRVIECPACKRIQEPTETCANPQCKLDIRDVKSPLAGLRFHDLRHQAITELAESQASDQTIMSIAGHVSRQMLEHYSHVRLDRKRQALDALVNRPKPAPPSDGSGYDTKNATNKPHEDSVLIQPLEKNGRGERI